MGLAISTWRSKFSGKMVHLFDLLDAQLRRKLAWNAIIALIKLSGVRQLPHWQTCDYPLSSATIVSMYKALMNHLTEMP